MKVIDISKNIFEAPLYEGDTKPQLIEVLNIANGYDFNLSDIVSCVHNGTHIDAPLHVSKDGADVSKIDISKCIGECVVVDFCRLEGHLKGCGNTPKRILLKNGIVTPILAKKIVDSGVAFLGVQGVSVGDKQTHKILLEGGVVVGENFDLSVAKEGTYFLSALPVNLGKAEGAFCRAALVIFD